MQHSGLPFVLVNMAMTADGKIATANRAIHSFSSARDLAHLYELRATADAVMCGARTVEISQSLLDPGGVKFRRRRLKRGLAEYNLRVIVSGSGSIDPRAEIFKKRFSPLIVLTTGRATPGKLAQLRELADVVRVCGKKEIDFRSALRWLHAKWNVRRLLCEGGGELNDALFRAVLVDELHLTICPKIFGGRDAPTIAEGPSCQKLVDAQGFQIQSARRRQDELFTVFSRRK
jgi:2,5-diamino-6-(ribosylamino)-4(3H)-pyrimidinone 5'-phosphate reductase